MQRGRQQQLLTCNTPNSKCHSQCFVRYSVLTGEKQQTPFFKKVFVVSSVSFCITYFKFELHVGYHVFPISLEGPLNCICTYVNIKAESYYILLNPKLKIKFYNR